MSLSIAAVATDFDKGRLSQISHSFSHIFILSHQKWFCLTIFEEGSAPTSYNGTVPDEAVE